MAGADSEDIDYKADQDPGQTTDAQSSKNKKGKEKKEKGSNGKKKGKKKKKSKKIKVAREMVMNERGEMVTTTEYLLEKSTKQNQDIQESIIQQEMDAVQVVAALHRENENSVINIKNMQLEMQKKQFQIDSIQSQVNHEFASQQNELMTVISEKDVSYKIMQQEFQTIKDLRVKRFDLLQELKTAAQEQAETERRQADIASRLEKKFFEEKVRLQDEAGRKIEELANKAHNEAIMNLKDTTKDVYKENIRMSEALIFLVAEGVTLRRCNNEFMTKNRDLIQENELNSVIVKEKVAQTKNQALQIQQLRDEINSMENTLTQVVQKLDQDRQALKYTANNELAQVKKIIADLSRRLSSKSVQMLHIKRVAQHILNQRTEMEEFFMDALEEVKFELRSEQALEFKQSQEKYMKNMKQLIRNKDANISKMKPLKPIKSKEITNLLQFDEAQAETEQEKNDIRDLSWKEKENILRVLFTKMNGISVADDNDKKRLKAKAELKRNSKHLLGGFSKLEPLVLEAAITSNAISI